MTNEEKSIIKGKKWEAIIGLYLLLPPVLGIISFVLRILGNESKFARLKNFYYSSWTLEGSNPVPIFMALIAIAGVLLLKGNLQYLLMKGEKQEESDKEEVKSTEEPKIYEKED